MTLYQSKIGSPRFPGGVYLSLFSVLMMLGVHLYAQTNPPRQRAKTDAKAPAAKVGQISLDTSSHLIVEDGKGRGLFKLENKGGTTVTARLGIATIQDVVTRAVTKGTVKLEGAAKSSDSDVWELVVPAEGKTATMVVESMSWQPGTSDIGITEGGNAIGAIKVDNLRPPLDKISVPEGRYMVGPSQTNVLQLKNSDNTLWFPLKWRLVIDGKPSSDKTVVLRPGETVQSPLADVQASWNQSWWKDVDKDGSVEVDLQNVADRSFLSRSIPVKLRVVRSTRWQAAGYLSIFVLILTGALLSYGVNAVLPNLQKIVGMKGEVAELDRRICGVSDRIDSRLRVLLEVEMRRLRARANAAKDTLSPNFSDSYVADMDALGSLKSRIDHIELLDTLRAQFNALDLGSLPPKVVFDMDAKLQGAADLLRQVRPTQGELENARTTLQEAAVQMKSLGTGSDISDELKAEAKSLREGFGQLDAIDVNAFFDMIPALLRFPDLKNSAADQNDAEAKKNVKTDPAMDVKGTAVQNEASTDMKVQNEKQEIANADSDRQSSKKLVLQANLEELAKSAKIPIEKYSELGSQLYKLRLALEYLQLEANTKDESSQNKKLAVDGPVPVETDKNTLTSTPVDLKSRLESKRFDFLEKLRLNCWAGLQAARLLLNELKCNTFPEDLRREIEDHPQRVGIKSNPPSPVTNVPTELCVCFNRSAYEQSAARDELFCSWQFDSGSPEKGWTVWHAFDKAGTHKVTVTFRDATGRIVLGRGEHPIEVSAEYVIPSGNPKRSNNHRLFIQGLQFMVSLVVVVAALMAGALEKIDALDCVTAAGTLIGIGFAANTVKNLIAPSSTKTS